MWKHNNVNWNEMIYPEPELNWTVNIYGEENIFRKVYVCLIECQEELVFWFMSLFYFLVFHLFHSYRFALFLYLSYPFTPSHVCPFVNNVPRTSIHRTCIEQLTSGRFIQHVNTSYKTMKLFLVHIRDISLCYGYMEHLLELIEFLYMYTYSY